MSLDRRALIAAGGIREQCAEVVDRVKCLGVCGETFAAADWASAAACPVCGSDRHRYVCTRCERLFDAPMLTGEHPCGSIAVYDSTNRVVFEEAVEAYGRAAERAAEEERSRERKRKAREADARRKREEGEREEAERVERRAREAAERAAREAADKAAAEKAAADRERAAREAAEKGKSEPAGLGDRRARISVRLAGAAAALGGFALVQGPWEVLPGDGRAWLFGYGLAVLALWFIGVTPLISERRAVATLRAWAPLPWAFACFAWPAVGAAMLCQLVAEFSVSLAFAGQMCMALALLWVMLSWMTRMGVAMTITPPSKGGAWPSGIPATFKGMRSLWVWLGLLVTVLANLSVAAGGLAGVAALNELTDAPSSAPATAPATAPAPAKSGTAPAASSQTARTVKVVGQLSRVVHAQADLSRPYSAGVLAAVDEAIAALESTPRPAQGDRKRARALLEQGRAMLRQPGRELEAAQLMLRAHEADPLDVQIVNDLGFAQTRAGQFDAAAEHLMRALELAPMRASAWVNLGELQIALAVQKPKLVDDAVRFLVTGYWFSKDGARAIQFFRDKLAAAPAGSPAAQAFSRALARIEAGTPPNPPKRNR